jgi:hypothetical protein
LRALSIPMQRLALHGVRAGGGAQPDRVLGCVVGEVEERDEVA